MQKKLKPIPRHERKHARARMFSFNFPDNFSQLPSKCIVPWEDHLLLMKKYERLFKRYRREVVRERQI